jgi:trehalose 6-phosphate synthase/phosphatase
MPGEISAKFNRLVIASYRLPFKTVQEGENSRVERNSGGLVSAILSFSEKVNVAGSAGPKIVWIGKSDSNDDAIVNDETTSGAFTVIPVTIDKPMDDKFYGGFCNELIWPLFHYFPSRVVLNEDHFENYLAANRLFAEVIKKNVRNNDLIWIHDYHLFFLPQLLREALPNANIGFFLHIPFPVFELFRTIPRRWCERILRGMLGADCVGFHTNDYCQYFLRSVSRYLGCETSMNTVTADERVVRVDAFPLGIDYEKFNSAASTAPEVQSEKKRIAESLAGRKLIFSIDRLDYSKGLLHRLDAFELFLESFPEWLDKIVFNMVVFPSRGSITPYQKMKHDIEATVGRINGKYGTMTWRPVVYQYKSLSFTELVALYDMSSAGLITPLRDGMNLVAKEYIACQTTIIGVLILSETAGAAAELSEALLINPTDRKEVAEAINKALVMPDYDRTVLLKRMQKRLRNYTVFTWAADFLSSMELIKKEQEVRKIQLITATKESEIFSKFREASRRAIFMDYDGTLVPFAKVPELAVPGAQAMDLLKKLSGDEKNSIVIISGREKGFLQKWFGGLRVHLIAEHGAFRKPPEGEWVCTIDPDQQWKGAIVPVLQRYSNRCNGSFIEEKFASLAWHYRNSPPEIGAMRAKELTEEIRTLVAHENKLHVIEGSKVVEIKRTGYDKGVAALKFVSDDRFDFILAMGDDRTDEDIFRLLPAESITIKIGIRQSLAKYNLRNQLDVARFLGKLAAAL